MNYQIYSRDVSRRDLIEGGNVWRDAVAGPFSVVPPALIKTVFGRGLIVQNTAENTIHKILQFFVSRKNRCLGPLALGFLFLLAASAHAGVESQSKVQLQHALYLSNLYNWLEAKPVFVSAEKGFLQAGDKRNAQMARLGEVRATIETRNLPLTSAMLEKQLASDPIFKQDEELRLFCLTIKGDIDREIDARLARKDWEEVKDIATKRGDVHWQNRALAEIGISAFYEGDLGTARQNVGTAVEVAHQIHDSAAEARFTTVLGEAMLKADLVDRALSYFDHAIQLTQSVSDAGFPSFASECRLEALITLKRYTDAQKLADELLDRYQASQSFPAIAETLFLSSRIALARGEVHTAIEELEKSITLCDRIGLQQVSTGPKQLLAEIYRKQGSLEKAEQFQTLAASAAQQSGDRWTTPQLLRTLAEVQIAHGKYANADETFSRAEALIEAALTNSSTVMEKTAYVKAFSDLYREHCALAISKLHNPAKAYAILEQVRGRVTADLLWAGSIHSAKAMAVEKAIAKLQLQLMSAVSTAEIHRLRDQMFETQRSRWITPGINILRRHPEQTASLGLVRQHLDPNTIVLEYVVADPESYCLVITDKSVRAVILVGKNQIDHLTEYYVAAIHQRSHAHAESQALFHALLAPIGDLSKSKRLIIVRDGILHQIPFDALEDGLGRFVVDSQVVSYVPSVTTGYLLTLHRGRKPMNRLLAVGGVTYTKQALIPVSLVPANHDSPADLPFSRTEVMNANSAVHGPNTLLLGSRATESAFKQEAGRRYDVIHMAVHGISNPSDADESALVLLPDEKAGEDGLLHAAEIAMLHLDTGLVVLSACDTAVGPTQGEEGIATLSESFLLAGAKGVVSTLWSVTDTSSLFLMEHFYSGLAAGQSSDVALTMAKRQLLHKFGPEALPYDWGAFTFEGTGK